MVHMNDNPYKAPKALDNQQSRIPRLVQTIAKTAVLTYLALAVGVGFWVCLLYFAVGLWR